MHNYKEVINSFRNVDITRNYDRFSSASTNAWDEAIDVDQDDINNLDEAGFFNMDEDDADDCGSCVFFNA